MLILLNAANLHNGGGVAVAASVIQEVSQCDLADTVTVVASTEVDANARSLGAHTERFARYQVFDQHGIRGLWHRLPLNPRKFDRVLNIFGPIYDFRAARGSVMGFAQPWIAFPDNPMSRRLSRFQRLRLRLRHRLQSAFFALAETLVVEQEIVADALRSNRLLRRLQVAVVPNRVDPVFANPVQWDAVTLPGDGSQLRLGVVSSNYPHKNLQVIPAMLRSLGQDHGLKATFYVTLTESQWQAMPDDFRGQTVNVGPLTLPQSASFTNQLDAVVFPTLLECFSATPLEARALGTPLFASDIPAVNAPMGDYPIYIDPLDPIGMAATIAEWAKGGRQRSAPIEPAQGPESRGRSLLALCGVGSSVSLTTPSPSTLRTAAGGRTS